MRIFVFITEISIIMLVLVVFITQVIVPAFKGTRFFPVFRSRKRELREQVLDVHENAEDQETEEYIKRHTNN